MGMSTTNDELFAWHLAEVIDACREVDEREGTRRTCSAGYVGTWRR